MKPTSAKTISTIALVAALGLVGSAMVSQSDYGRHSSEPQATPPMSAGALMQSSQQGSAGGRGELARWAQDKRVRDITGKGLYNRAGTWLGKIDKVVLDIVTAEPMAVVDVGGGFLGIGGEAVTLPLAEIEMRGGELVATAIVSAAGLKARPAYKRSEFVEITADQMLSDYGAFGPEPSQLPVAADGAPQYRL